MEGAGWRRGGERGTGRCREGGERWREREGGGGRGREGEGEGEGEGQVGREVMTSLSPSHSGFLVCFFRHYLPDKNLLPSSEYVCVSHGLRKRTSFVTCVCLSYEQGHVTHWRGTGGGSLPTLLFTAGVVR